MAGRSDPRILRSLPPVCVAELSSLTGISTFGISTGLEMGGSGFGASTGLDAGAAGDVILALGSSTRVNVCPVAGSRTSVSMLPPASIEIFATVTLRSDCPGNRSVMVSFGRGPSLAGELESEPVGAAGLLGI